MSREGEPGHDSLPQIIAAFDRLWKINPEDIEADWIDAMAKRLLSEINRQLAKIEGVKYDNPTSQPSSSERLDNARALASLRDTLEKVSQARAKHQVTIENRKARDYVNARQGVQHRADQRIAATQKKRGS
jgi:hypothetical protein